MKPQLLIGAATSGSGKNDFYDGAAAGIAQTRSAGTAFLNVVLIILIHNFIRWLLTMSR